MPNARWCEGIGLTTRRVSFVLTRIFKRVEMPMSQNDANKGISQTGDNLFLSNVEHQYFL